ncbi:membrane motb of proton-channel complex mota/motb [Lucifera butyrica]|uniref:Membrane motb of proton-channel complex mota/motb n=1 Tax=Lucifera butyrica TaxID=1351585 RepID=A0A498R4Y6_9FIRM|nr:OmpA family protein [Lucifera butyrica]VBB05322.1 membrane motb of proton-channel complex mota/motb [Lucifera butyrica]
MLRRRGGSSRSEGGHDAAGMMRWLLTYADLITLLMVFFVVMYAMSVVDQKKYNALKETLQLAFHTESAGANLIMPYPGETPNSASVPQDNALRDTKEFQEIIKKIQAGVKDPNEIAFNVDERGLTIRFMDSVLFDLGRADLRADSLPLLDAVGEALKGKTNYIRVEGHTDDLPIHTSLFPSNWELSAARSIAVTRYLIERHGMDPKRLSSLGYGEYHPLYPNTTEENRAKNRRVDVVILRSNKAGGEIDFHKNQQ